MTKRSSKESTGDAAAEDAGRAPAAAETAEPALAEESGVEPEEVDVASDAEATQDIEQLRSELGQAQAQASEYLDGWQRAQAEFANYRKRQQSEQQQRTQMANAGLIARTLPVLDDLERAVQTVPPSIQGLTWIDGVFLIKRRLEAILESEGLRPIETDGQRFDPRYHEAVTYEEAEGYEEGQVIDQVQRGYMMGDRVVRPALVRVARAPQPPPETEKPETTTDDADKE